MSANGKRSKVVSRSETGKLLVPTGNVETMIFHIHNLEGYTQKRGEHIFTEINQAHGYSWKLWIFPRGHRNSATDEEYVSVYLRLDGTVDRKVEAVADVRIGRDQRKTTFPRYEQLVVPFVEQKCKHEIG